MRRARSFCCFACIASVLVDASNVLRAKSDANGLGKATNEAVW